MKSLTSFLVSKGVVAPELLQEVLLNQTLKGGDIGTNLLELGAISDSLLVRMTAQFHRLLAVSLHDLLDARRSSILIVPGKLASEYKVVPFNIEGENLYLACIQPPPREDEEVFKRATNKLPRWFVASPVAIAIALWVHYGVKISRRIAKIIERLNRQEGNFIEEIAGKVDEDKRSHLFSIVEKRWDEFPVKDTKIPEVRAVESQEDEEEEEDETTGEIISKYIVIDRIGRRPRKSSGIFVKNQIVEKGINSTGAGEQPGAIGPATESASDVKEDKMAEMGKAVMKARGFPVPITGMLTMAETCARISEAGNARQVVEIVYQYSTQFFEFVIMFQYKKGRFALSAISTKSWGWVIEDFSIQYVNTASFPDPLIKLARPFIFDVEEDHPVGILIRECGRDIPPNSVLIPISVQNRVVTVIYGDRGGEEVRFNDISDLIHVAWMASNRLLDFEINS